jgi:predicted Na+-dependent transporter
LKNPSIFKIALLLAALLFITVLGFALAGHLASAGPFAIAGFLVVSLRAKLSGLPPEIAAGIILIGCSPNGLVSSSSSRPRAAIVF